jgi:hypothetical protein
VQFLGATHVAQIHQRGPLHHALEAFEVEGVELLPFGDDDEGVGAFGAGIGTLTEFDACERLPDLLDVDRIVSRTVPPISISAVINGIEARRACRPYSA